MLTIVSADLIWIRATAGTMGNHGEPQILQQALASGWMTKPNIVSSKDLKWVQLAPISMINWLNKIHPPNLLNSCLCNMFVVPFWIWHVFRSMWNLGAFQFAMFARYLGIDPITDGDLMWIADEVRKSPVDSWEFSHWWGEKPSKMVQVKPQPSTVCHVCVMSWICLLGVSLLKRSRRYPMEPNPQDSFGSLGIQPEIIYWGFP